MKIEWSANEFTEKKLLYRETAWFDFNFYIIKPILCMLVDVRNNPKPGLDLIWDILEQFLCILNSYDASIITYTNIDRATLRIGKAAYPFEVFVFPTFLVFYVLTFFLKHV